MRHVTLPVRLELIGPIMTQSSEPGDLGIDTPIARNEEGKVTLPFSLVKGKISESWRDLGFTADDEWFGKGASVFQPSRGRFRFSDFVATKGAKGILHRIRIDDERNAADDGALQFIESPFKPGEKVTFEGSVSWIEPETKPAPLAELKQAFRWTPGYGAEKTVGFGETASVAFSPMIETTITAAATSDTDTTPIHGLRLEVLDPFCIATRKIDGNLFDSDTTIPGNVIRGVLASTFNAILGRDVGRDDRSIIDGNVAIWPTFGKWFNAVRFTAAFPIADRCSNRPVVPPLSIVKDGNGNWWDAALVEGPFVFSDGKSFRAPEFAIDWKESSAVNTAFGWCDTAGAAASPSQRLRVRTAMDGKRRRSKDQELFAYVSTSPRGFTWHASMDLSDVDEKERPQVRAELQALFASCGNDGIPALGKTKARVRFVEAAEPVPFIPSSPEPVEGDVWILTLQTKALLCDPHLLDESSDGGALHAAYAAAIEERSGNTLRLVRFFARQSLAGGTYLHGRFRKGSYEPFLLTEAGSTFVLQASDPQKVADAQKKIDGWRTGGLTLPQWAEDRYGVSWQTNPFLPMDGFGEVTVNLPPHVEKKPTDVELVAIPEVRA
jgi:hypothetical protein